MGNPDMHEGCYKNDCAPADAFCIFGTAGRSGKAVCHSAFMASATLVYELSDAIGLVPSCIQMYNIQSRSRLLTA